jgi:uncharacterized protein
VKLNHELSPASTSHNGSVDAQRFSRLEDPNTDFPYYNGAPTSISSRQWLFVIASIVVAFMVLASPIHWPNGILSQLIPALALPGIPLIALAIVAPAHWKAIFGKVGGREIKLMFGFALLNIIVSMSIGAAVRVLTEVTPNASTDQLGNLGSADRLVFFAKTIPQLLGEEVITLLPFLAILYWLTNKLGVGRKRAIIGAWLFTAIAFGLIHLPTYDWNWVQCIVVIGSARIMLTLPWVMTKNIWVSTGAHIINDWLLFGMTILGAGLVGKV